MNKLVLLLITFYQQYLSPLKGYRCAYASLHGGHSCSAVVKNIVADKGVFAGYVDIRHQFEQCTLAYNEIQKSEKKKKQKKKEDKGDCSCLDVIDCVPIPSCKGKSSGRDTDACGIPDLPCDCNPF